MSFAFEMAGYLALSGFAFLFVWWVADHAEGAPHRPGDVDCHPPEAPFAGARFFFGITGFVCATACFVVAGLFSFTGTILAIAGVG